MDIESVISVSSRAQQVNDSVLGDCSKTWHVGFFFDGIHRNIEQDAPEHLLPDDKVLLGWSDNAWSPYDKHNPKNVSSP